MRQAISFEGLVGGRCPVFARESSRGRLELGAYLGLKPIVLLFVPDLAAADCGAYLSAFAADYEHYRALDAMVIAVTAGGASGGDLPFPVISEGRDIFEQFKAMSQGSLAAGVMLVDRYGQVRYAQLAASCPELPADCRPTKKAGSPQAAQDLWVSGLRKARLSDVESADQYSVEPILSHPGRVSIPSLSMPRSISGSQRDVPRMA